MKVLESLERLLADVPALHCQLILLVGPPRSGKTTALLELAKKLSDPDDELVPLNIGSALGASLTSIGTKARPLEAANLLRELVDKHNRNGVLLLDNIELLFDHQLLLEPLDLLKRQAQSRPVVATWAGEVLDGRLTFASMGHPEYRDYAATGLVYLQLDV